VGVSGGFCGGERACDILVDDCILFENSKEEISVYAAFVCFIDLMNASHVKIQNVIKNI
jgi:hypothetical protein